MTFIGNILWLVLGGLFLALGYFMAGVIMFVLVLTIPFGVQAFKLGIFSLWPFGQVMVDQGRGTGGITIIGNVIWLLLGGLWLAMGHLLSAFLLAVTIIGIPFAVAHVKLAGAALTPFGKSVVSRDQAEAGRYHVMVKVDPLG